MKQNKASKLPDAILSAGKMKEILSLREIKQSKHVDELASDLLPVVKRNRLLLAMLDDEMRLRIKKLLDNLMDVFATTEIIREGLVEIGSPYYERLLYATFGTSASKASPRQLHRRLDQLLKKVSSDALTITFALSRVTKVKPRPQAKKPKSPYVPAAMELAEIWRKHTGKLPTSKTSTVPEKGNKKVLISASPSAHFMVCALRMIDPNVTSSSARTATRYAVKNIKMGLRANTPSTDSTLFSKLLEGRLKMKKGMPLVREKLRHTATRKLPR